MSLFVLLVILSTHGLEELQQQQQTNHSRSETTNNNNNHPFISTQIVQQYIQWHGASTLQSEKELLYPRCCRDRKYAVAYLSPCLDRAGNYLHNFIHSIVWGIITNRTVLVQFDTTAAPFYNHTTTTTTSADNLCGGQEHRIDPYLASWLPRWDDDYLDDEEDDWIVTPIPIDAERQRYDDQNKIVAFPQIPDILRSHQTSSSELFVFRNEWDDHALSNPIYRMVRMHEKTYRYPIVCTR
jgi:hypothetical protein